MPILRPFQLSARRAALVLGGMLMLLHLSSSLVGGVWARSGGVAEAGEPELRLRLSEWKRGRGEGAGTQVLDSLLAERVLHLRATAPTFDRAWQELERSGVPVVIGTRDQLEAHLPRFVRSSPGWVGITVSWGEGGEALSRSAVAIRVEWLRALHQRYGSPEPAFLSALDNLLIHEIYGHLVPVVERGDAARGCADPTPEQRLSESCVGRRELALRAERDSLRAARLAQSGPASSSW